MRYFALMLALSLASPAFAPPAQAQSITARRRARLMRMRRARHHRPQPRVVQETPPEIAALERETPPPMDISDDDVQARVAEERAQVLDPELYGEAAPAAPSEAPRFTPLEAQTSLRFFERTLSYSGYERGEVSSYALPFGFGLGFGADYFPGAHFGNDWWAHLGLSFDLSHSLFMQSQAASGDSYPTVAYNWILGVRARIPIAEHELAFEAGGGETGFRVMRGSPMQPPPQGVPGTDYDVFRFAVGGRVALGPFAITPRFAYLPAINVGYIGSQEYFPGASAHGVEAAVGVRYALEFGFEVHAEAELRLFALSFGNPGTAPVIASGAIDQTLTISGGLAWRMPNTF